MEGFNNKDINYPHIIKGTNNGLMSSSSTFVHLIVVNVQIVAHGFVSTISNDVINSYRLLLQCDHNEFLDTCGLMCAAVYAPLAIIYIT